MVAEAMSVGLPVVTTAVDGVTGILTEGDEPAAGAVVPLNDMRGVIRRAGPAPRRPRPPGP